MAPPSPSSADALLAAMLEANAASNGRVESSVAALSAEIKGLTAGVASQSTSVALLQSKLIGMEKGADERMKDWSEWRKDVDKKLGELHTDQKLSAQKVAILLGAGAGFITLGLKCIEILKAIGGHP